MVDGDNSLDRVWKEFGKQTQAGKLLFDLYGVRYRPDKFVSYPKIKAKTKEEKLKDAVIKSRPKSTSKLTQAINKISYPEPTAKATYKFHKVDFIPKRRKENVIKQELDDIRTNMIKHNNNNNSGSGRVNKNVNRKMQIESLQDKFLFQERTVMPKGARLPGIKPIQGKSHDNLEENNNDQDDINTNHKFYTKKEELRYLYSQIMKEIDERYVYMEEIKKLGKNMDLIIMAEIKDRLDELKKIKKMMDEEK